MPKRAFNLYQRKRVININANIFITGLISIAISIYPVKLLSGMIGHEHELLISVLAYIIDTTIDVFIYFGFHWIANHWKPFEDKSENSSSSKAMDFLRDAGRVQFERFVLAPLFAFLSISATWALQQFADMDPGWAFALAFIVSMCITRIIHTIWGYRSGLFLDRNPVLSADQALDAPSETTDGDTN
ncbi:MAG: hypothetical protein JKX70_05430 [Phycisphaerales bacterium]|nr:hypothetical protein [Phycisphaerales bacterium]